MADTLLRSRPFRTMPRMGMRRWAVVHDVDGQTVTVAEYHSWPLAKAACDRLNAEAETDGRS